MNAPLRTIPLTASLLESARIMAANHFQEGRHGTAIALNSLVAEVETLREGGRHEELKAAYERIKELECLLGDLDDYFDGRSDADCDQDGFIPNEEMKLLTQIRELL
jgi:hypothetical protein